MSSSHNERISAKRQQACLDFLQTTSTNLSTAKHYLKQTAYDLDRAVSLFYDAGGEALPSDDEAEPIQQEQDETQESSPKDDDDPITSIMNAVREKTPTTNEPFTNAFRGKGFSLHSSASSYNDENGDELLPELKVRVTFYKDGFTAQEEKEEAQNDTSSTRRRGVHSFSSSSSSAPRLPPLQTYEGNPQFIKDVHNSRVPVEYRRLGPRNRPVPVSIMLDDQRKRNYPTEIWQKQQQEEQAKPRSFDGTGQTLGGSNVARSSQSNRDAENENLFVQFLTFLLSLVRMVYSLITNWIRLAIPLEKHTVDHNKPTTNISLRMPKKRDRVVFNADHTVEDLRCYCRIEMETDEFELLAGFPPKPIPMNQNNESLKDAGLLNSAVGVRVFSSPEEKRRN